MPEYENGRFYPKVAVENARQSRERIIADIHSGLERIEAKQDEYGNRLSAIETRINSHLELVAQNTTSMSKSLETIQATNSKLVDVISSRSVMPTMVVMMLIVLLAGIFLTRELAMSGGRAKFSIDGLDISSGHHAVLDFKETPKSED